MTVVYIVMKNADFTEGRGPMMLHRVFANWQDAHEYIMNQDGIYGSAQGLTSLGSGHYNGYEIRQKTVEDSYDAASIRAAKQKLQDVQKQIDELQKQAQLLKRQVE